MTVGIDFGARRIGLAVSESGVIATAHSVVANPGDPVAAVAKIVRIGEELGCELYVVGIPRRTHRHEGNESRFERFAELLRQKSCRDVVLQDEALTSVAAEENLQQRGISRRDARGLVDMEAARIILQTYLDEAARGDA